MGIKQTMQRFGPARQFDEISLQRLGERVEQAPDIPGLEWLVTGFTPFVALMLTA